MLSIEKRAMKIEDIPAILWGETSKKLYLYIHGQGGCKEEAEMFSEIATQYGCQVLSIDLPEHGERKNEINSFDPWHAVPELSLIMEYAKSKWKQISLFANSIGAWFSMLSFENENFENCLFVSPVVDMKKLIEKMMNWANVSEAQLEKERIIPTDFGQTLSWEYWQYVLAHPILKWKIPTKILYGEKDHLVDRQIIEEFSHKFNCDLTIMENGEHWFHTEQQLDVMRRWVEEKSVDIDSSDMENIAKVYHTGDVYHNLGMTRETLRYYEEIGLINPKRSKCSKYREFDFFDMSHLMAIDFYKKRGFTPLEIKNILETTEPEEYDEIIERQICNLQNNIDDLQKMLNRLNETKNFYHYASDRMGEFIIKDLAPYYVKESIPSFASFEEYQDKVLSYLNLENEDILSNMVRAITFDETGYRNSQMYIVKPYTQEAGEQKEFLEDGKCLYTTLVADNNDNSIMGKMFTLCHEWAAQHDLSFRGVVYIFIRFVMLKKQTNRNYYEIWIPLK